MMILQVIFDDDILLIFHLIDNHDVDNTYDNDDNDNDNNGNDNNNNRNKTDANNANSTNNDRSIILFELLYLSKIELVVITKKIPLKNKL